MSAPQDDGLADFGYSQSLDRSIGKFASFAAGISYISILTGTFQLFYFGFAFGGPAYWWSWPLVFFGQVMVALCFAELAARYPVAGSVYNWSKRLAGPADVVARRLDDVHGLGRHDLRGRSRLPDHASADLERIPARRRRHRRPRFAVSAVIWGVVLVAFTTTVNAIGVRLMSRINSAGVFIELIAAVILVVLLGINIVNPPTVLFDTQGLGEGTNLGYFGAFLIATLASAYVMYGFDTASSLGEETVDPRRTAPSAILRAVIASFIIGGLILLFAILAAPDLADPAIGENGLQYIILTVLGGPVGTVLLFAVIIAITVCALAVHTAAIRLMFAMARDNALPGAARLAHLDPKRRTPLVPAVLIGVAAVLILVVNIGSREIFTAVTSVAIIMIYIAYLLVTAPMLGKRLAWRVAGTRGGQGRLLLARAVGPAGQHHRRGVGSGDGR